jgi:hypothetical protein
MSLSAEEYCATFEGYRRMRAEAKLPPQVEDLYEDELTRIWNELTVEDCRAIEERYPDLKVRHV